ncbi:branched-chain amino acid transport system carrier protein [Photobacterium aphoticum]|uniref:Branched-chain amino acid transport system carrier protein n=1 Tax=Photobacterium aphoticum TaxID=754436 RepID=A0A090QYC6_9GAMM|nr:branched-chain amino acid transport system carrier protein [Photobacterium aphoticum]
MDALGSIGFGWVIFRAIQSMGISCPKATAKYTLMAAVMYAVAMALVYLAWHTLARRAQIWVSVSPMAAIS